MVRQRTITKTTKELQRERRSNTTWQKEKTKTTREVIVRERTRKPVERPQQYRPKTVAPTERQQRTKTSTFRNKTVEKTKNPREKVLMGSLYRNVSELQNIIRQSSKERLQLERHLARATELLSQHSKKPDWLTNVQQWTNGQYMPVRMKVLYSNERAYTLEYFPSTSRYINLDAAFSVLFKDAIIRAQIPLKPNEHREPEIRFVRGFWQKEKNERAVQAGGCQSCLLVGSKWESLSVEATGQECLLAKCPEKKAENEIDHNFSSFSVLQLLIKTLTNKRYDLSHAGEAQQLWRSAAFL
ncbi:hypothetical protein AVEN_237862-1 [Araneus ventricosus]|uniref:Uncharacterized protein n=1 Tax=Araneus ventricosus TaxID=182803 RepID=A0A4Y2L6L4_ARAVE|nr:hypothetical protein AVEN_237862-1 [Araneus ventricosus]